MLQASEHRPDRLIEGVKQLTHHLRARFVEVMWVTLPPSLRRGLADHIVTANVAIRKQEGKLLDAQVPYSPINIQNNGTHPSKRDEYIYIYIYILGLVGQYFSLGIDFRVSILCLPRIVRLPPHLCPQAGPPLQPNTFVIVAGRGVLVADLYAACRDIPDWEGLIHE
jgi:hypothetical protein